MPASRPCTAWQTATTATSAQCTGVNGHTYSFYSIATDLVGNDASGNVWVANKGGGSVTEIVPGTTPAYANYTGAGIIAPASIVINPK